MSKIQFFRDVFQKDFGYFGVAWFVYDLALTRIYLDRVELINLSSSF